MKNCPVCQSIIDDASPDPFDNHRMIVKIIIIGLCNWPEGAQGEKYIYLYYRVRVNVRLSEW